MVSLKGLFEVYYTLDLQFEYLIFYKRIYQNERVIFIRVIN